MRQRRLLGMLAAVLLVVGTVSCDRGDKKPANVEEPPTEASSDYGSGEKSAGELKVEDLGPAAPAVYFLAGLKGYTEPCGCTADVLLGGIDRIVGYVSEARDLHPAMIMVDAGDWLFETATLDDHMHPQERAKADVLAAAHKELQTAFTVPGERDFALGTAFYLEKIAQTDMKLLGGNLTIGERVLEGTHVAQLEDVTVGFIGVVDPALYEGIEGISITEAAPAVAAALESLAKEQVDVRVLVFHGELGPAKQLMEAHDGLDFVVIGHGPRETDQVDAVNGGHTLEAYDQGRYVGVLKLYNHEGEPGFINARLGSEAEVETLGRQIEHVTQSIERLTPAPGAEGDEPPMLARLRERLAGLDEQRTQIQDAEITLPEDRSAFLYRPVAIEPGYALNAKITTMREAYNRNLRELNSQLDREVVPVADGEPFFIGTNECKTCHGAAHTFWEGTAHAGAMATLEERDKDFDQSCVGCHVVGWELPGGSVLGKLEYEAKLGEQHFQKNLRDVGCESCHGPGSEHRLSPLGADGKAHNILARPTEAACATCHVPEHSPRFDFDNYVRRITGQGHEYSGSED